VWVDLRDVAGWQHFAVKGSSSHTFSHTLANTRSYQSNTLSNVAHLPSGHFGTLRIPDYAVEMHGSSENSPFSSFDRVTILGRVLSGVCDPSGKASLRPQAYTACSEQTGRGFFERVCTKQRARPSQRPTPTPQRKGTGVPAPGLRPEVDHAPR
jgi:hypothetical protein